MKLLLVLTFIISLPVFSQDESCTPCDVNIVGTYDWHVLVADGNKFVKRCSLIHGNSQDIEDQENYTTTMDDADKNYVDSESDTSCYIIGDDCIGIIWEKNDDGNFVCSSDENMVLTSEGISPAIVVGMHNTDGKDVTLPNGDAGKIRDKEYSALESGESPHEVVLTPKAKVDFSIKGIEENNSNMMEYCAGFWDEGFLGGNSDLDKNKPLDVPSNSYFYSYVKNYLEKNKKSFKDCQADVSDGRQEAPGDEGSDPTTPACRRYVSDINEYAKEFTNIRGTGKDAKSITFCRSLRVVHAFNKYKVQGDGDTARSMDGSYNCEVKGSMEQHFSVDFKSCQRLVNTYNAAFIAEQAMTAGIQLTDAGKQNNIMTGMAASEDNAQITALNGQADMEKKKAGNETAKEAFFATKGVTIGAMLFAYVTPNNFPRKCAKMKGMGDSNMLEQLCHKAVMLDSENTNSFMFGNREMKGAFAQAAAIAGVKAVAADIQRRNHKKNEAMLRDAAVNLDDKTYDGLGINEGEVLIANECQLNPNAHGCQDGGEITYHNPYDSGGLTFEGGENNSFDFTGGGDEAVPLANDYGDINQDSIHTNPIITGSSKKSSRGDVAAGAAASVSRGGNNIGQTGGGGGGGGGGAAGLGRGAGKAKGKSGLSNIRTGVRYGKRKKGLRYGKGRGLASGASGRRKSKNPFDTKGNSKGGVKINRNLAAHDIVSARAGSIFERISNRYAKVQSQNRVDASGREVKKVKK